jgi:hypothetical protein
MSLRTGVALFLFYIHTRGYEFLLAPRLYIIFYHYCLAAAKNHFLLALH